MFDMGMGYKLIESPHMTIADGRMGMYVDREFKERWFGKLYGKKWMPFVSKKLLVVTRWIPDPSLYKAGDRIMGHPATLQALRSRIENE